MSSKVNKAPMKTDGGAKFPASAYAYVGDPEKPSTWKLRLFATPSDVPSKPSVRHTAAAAQALSPAGFRGNRVELPSEEVAGVKARVARAWMKARVDRGDEVSRDDLPASLKAHHEDTKKSGEAEKEAGFTPPKGVQQAAARGLELRREYGRGGTEVGIARARDLSNGKSVSLETIGRMVSFFARHGGQNAGDPPAAGEDPDNGYIAWLLWGGDAGQRWANKVWRQNKKVEKTAYTVVLKAEGEEEERTAYGVVLEPETTDTQGEIYSEDEIRKTAWAFLEKYQNFGLMHEEIRRDIRPLESYLAPVDFEVNGDQIKKGTWMLRVRVLDDQTWEDIKTGKLTGFSIGGYAKKERLTEDG